MSKCTEKMWDIHATDYSAMRKEYIPPFVTTWMDLKHTELSKTSQTEKTSAVWYHLYMKSKKEKAIKNRVKQWWLGNGGR